MFERISNSWELVKASAAVLRHDKELVIFPIISAIGTLIVTLTFAVPYVLSGLLDSLMSGGSDNVRILSAIVAFLFYLVQYFVIFFANSALVGAALIRLRGGDPTLGDGLRIAGSHVGSIFGYALVAATVGMILRWISERGALGRIVSSLVGLAWNVATYLVVPILVMEDVGPIEAVQRSTRLLKKTWGEQVVGNLSIGIVFGLLFFGTILAGALLIYIASLTGSTAAILAVAVLVVLALIGLGLISATLNGIYAAAVYEYTVTGKTGGNFDERLIQNAFRPR
ncbi:MAG: hypothetical protein EXR62_15050 [Chloroflexi bacterium]|nr:hypothetical protein [Chloroflexota bacterium]